MPKQRSQRESVKSALTRKTEESAHSLEALNGPPCCSRSAKNITTISKEEKAELVKTLSDGEIKHILRIFPNAKLMRLKWLNSTSCIKQESTKHGSQ